MSARLDDRSTAQPKGNGVTTCPRCGGSVAATKLGQACLQCDKVGDDDKFHMWPECPACDTERYARTVAPRTRGNPRGLTARILVHYLTDSTICPTPQQIQAEFDDLSRIQPGGRAARPAQRTQGDDVHANQTPSEVTGIRSAVTKMEQIAKAHSRISNAEGFLGSLRKFDAGQPDQQNFLNAQEASKTAEAAWRRAADTIRAHNLPVSEAYRVSPDAANKHANTNE